MSESVSEQERQRVPKDLLPVIPVRNLVVFPGAVTHLSIGRDLSVSAAEIGVEEGRTIGVLLQRDPTVDAPTQGDLYEVGTTVNVIRLVEAPNGFKHLICQGEQRFRVDEFLPDFKCLVVRATPAMEVMRDEVEVRARAEVLKQLAVRMTKLLPEAPEAFTSALMSLKDPAMLADMTASILDLKPSEKQDLLELLDLEDRLDRVITLGNEQLRVLEISREIGAKSKEKIDERQREYLLREQLKTIQEALGEGAGAASQIDELEAKVAQAGMPPEVETEARKELTRLANMPEASTEFSMVLSYLDWLTTLPWKTEAVTHVDMQKARQILDSDHHGLEKVKRRILEYLAVRKLNPEGRSPILCFVGPPGVGKTSLGKSIAKALDLEFVRASLGGVHDEAEIRGHRRTYVGALPGSIIQGIKKAGMNNPVFMLDEMDKLGASAHGDPSAALLEVLDPEQNSTFQDNYLNVPYDLSKVLFVGTANVVDNIPGPLRDRMEMIELPGYTQEEKLEIAQRYLVARQRESNGLSESQVSIDRDALAFLIEGYTREAGVRNLEREIGRLMRHAAVQIAEGKVTQIRIDTSTLKEISGPPTFERETQMRTSLPGVATGLAWTPAGGDILFVESSTVPGEGQLILTGQLGEVMKESAQAAVSLAKNKLDCLSIPPDFLLHRNIHVHVPAGAIPKDGPSAGVAMFVAVMSLLANRKVRSDIAMTGEISLRGLVLPVGGVKEKTLAALRSGIRTVLLPARNRKDLTDIPEAAQAELEFVWLETVDDALAVVFEEEPA